MFFPATEAHILDIAECWLESGHRVALATVIGAAGSAPRLIGSHIAVREDGNFAGSVSAGCVENGVIELAQAAIADGKMRGIRFGPDANILEVGLPCGGDIEILIEPVSGRLRAEMKGITGTLLQDRAIVRAIDLESGASELLAIAHDISPLTEAATQAARREVSQLITINGRRWFLSVYNPPLEIVIIGAVHIAQALAALAVPAGYRVRVIDPRGPYATAERFSGVQLETDWPEQALSLRPLTPCSALIALAHDPKLDDEALIMAARSDAFYVGALGSSRTQRRRLERLAGKGLTSEQLGRIRGPVGLALGARTPAEIAIAILAELVQIRRRPPNIAAVVLAAGSSSRMGSNKLLMQVGDKLLLRHAVDAARAGGLAPIIVVTGHEAQGVRNALTDCDVSFIHNDAYLDGLSMSLRAGIAAVPAQCDGAMLFLADMPDIDHRLVRSVATAFDPARGRSIIVATAKGERGHPVLCAKKYFAEMMSLSGDRGAKSLMAAHSNDVFEIETSNLAPVTDIDTPEALAAYSANAEPADTPMTSDSAAAGVPAAE